MFRSRLAVAVLAVLLLVPVAAGAAPFTRLVVFGDSLSDNGNVYAATGGALPPAPYAQRYSNGPVAVEYAAQALGIPLIDYAYGGATTGRSPQQPNYTNYGGLQNPVLPNIGNEVDNFLATNTVNPATAFILWGGPNDLFLAQAQNTNPLTLGAELQVAATTAVTNLLTYAATLSSLGAGRIVVPGLPDLGLTPAFLGSPLQGSVSQLAALFNAALSTGLQNIPNAVFFDTSALLHQVVANPAAFGFANVTNQCIQTPACVANMAIANQYLFWDSVHPTTAAHAFLGGQLAQAVPEPVTVLLIASGLAAALAGRRVRMH